MQFLIIIAFGMIMLTDQFKSPMIIAAGPAGAFAIISSIFAVMMIIIRAGRKKIVRDLESGYLPLTKVQNTYSKCQNKLRVLAIIGQTLLMFGTQWPTLVRSIAGEHYAGLDELIMVLPFLMWIVAGYYFLYPGDRAIRETMIGQMLELSEPVHPVWTRWQYVDFQMRFQVLLIGVPLFFIVIAKDILAITVIKEFLISFSKPILDLFGLGKFAKITPEGMLAIMAGCVFLFSPVLIKIIWKTIPLPAGELRTALERIAKNAKLNYNDILLWPTYGIIVNAAVIGFFGRMRYIILSDSLIESLTDGQIEGVFGHEIGHVKLHHLPYLLFFAMASMGLIGLTGIEIQIAFELDNDMTQLITIGVVMLVWYFAFGFVSRHFEAQADLFGSRLLSDEFTAETCTYKNCLRHQPYVPPSRGQQPLCLAGAELFSSALDRTASLNAIPRKAGSWRHGSIYDRCKFVVRAAEDLPTLLKFWLRVRLIKLALLLACVITAVWGLTLLERLKHMPDFLNLQMQ